MGNYLEQPLFNVWTRVETLLASLLVRRRRFVFCAYPPLYILRLLLIFFYFVVANCQRKPVTLRSLPTPTYFSQDRHPSRVHQFYLVNHFCLFYSKFFYFNCSIIFFRVRRLKFLEYIRRLQVNKCLERRRVNSRHVTPQTPKGPTHERDVSSTCKFFLFDNSIHIIIIKCQQQELS